MLNDLERVLLSEEQIKEKVKDNQNQAIQDRYKDKLFYEELEKEYGNYFEEPVW